MWGWLLAIITALAGGATVSQALAKWRQRQRDDETARIDARIDARIEAKIRPMIDEVKDAIASSDALRVQQHHENSERLSVLETTVEERKHRRNP
jgi:uncharacterized membrane protein